MTRLSVTWNQGSATFDQGVDVVVGRDSDVGIRLDNPNVSRRHAELIGRDGRWVLRDLGSAQGVWQDGRLVQEVEVRGTIRVTLGREGRGEVLTLEPETPRAVDLPGTVVVGDRAARPDPVGSSDGTVIVGHAEPQRPGGGLRNVEAGATVVTGDHLTIECAGRLHTFAPHQQVVVGRQADCDVVSSNPTVSRHHVRLLHDGTGWQLVDDGSARGTFVDGRRVSELRLAGSIAVWLGDPAAGERLVIVTDGESSTTRRIGSRRPTLVQAVGALAALTVLIVAAVLLLRSPGGAGDDDLARATVRLDLDGRIGAGTIIDARRGLILTSADLVAPDAPGAALRRRRFDRDLPGAPERIEVLVSAGLGMPAEPRFLAEVVAVDGYLDLAVLELTETVGGRFLAEDDDALAGLVEAPLSDADLDPGDRVRIFGASQASGPTVQDALVSGTVRDDRIGTNRAVLTLSAPSDAVGGPATVDGRVAGVMWPAFDGAGRLRPIGLGAELIESARRGEPYTSPWYRPLTTERLGDVTVAATDERPGLSFGCAVAGPAPTAGDDRVAVTVAFERFTRDEHQDLLVVVQSGDDVVGLRDLTDEFPVDWPSDEGCATVVVELTEPLAGEAAQGLSVRVGLGPSYVQQS